MVSRVAELFDEYLIHIFQHGEKRIRVYKVEKLFV